MINPEPERPLECSECKRHIEVEYTEIVGKMIWRAGMCAECPLLRKKLSGSKEQEYDQLSTNLCCGTCGTTKEEIHMGALCGCSTCYEVFEEDIIQALSSNTRLPQKGSQIAKFASLHIGHRPGQISRANPALKLLALNQALHETITKEDYEQAAWLRDQIKALTEDKNLHEKK